MISDTQCGASYTPATSTGLVDCVLVASEQLPDEPTGKKVAHAVLGGAAGAVVVVLCVSNPAGWVVGAGIVIGAVAG